MSEPAPIATRARDLVVGGRSIRALEALDVDAALNRAVAESRPAPYGVVLWSSGVALAEAIADRDLRGLRVVDVGAGVGVTSLLAATLGAEVIALDHDELALSLVKRAADEAGLKLTTQRLDLHSDEQLPLADLYLFADLLYEPKLAIRVAARVLEARANGGDVLLADPDRVGRVGFVEFLSQAGVHAPFTEHRVRVPGDEDDSIVGLFALSPEPA